MKATAEEDSIQRLDKWLRRVMVIPGWRYKLVCCVVKQNPDPGTPRLMPCNSGKYRKAEQGSVAEVVQRQHLHLQDWLARLHAQLHAESGKFFDESGPVHRAAR